MRSALTMTAVLGILALALPFVNKNDESFSAPLPAAPKISSEAATASAKPAAGDNRELRDAMRASVKPQVITAPQFKSGSMDEADLIALEIEELKQTLLEDPHEENMLQRLHSIAVIHPEFRSGIYAFVLQLFEGGNGAAILAETLAELAKLEGDFKTAAEYLRHALPWTDRPFSVSANLQMMELEAGDYHAAITAADEQTALVSDYLDGKRDASLIKDVVHDSHLVSPCFFRAIAYAKLDEPVKARAALTDCGKGVIPEEERAKSFGDDFKKIDMSQWRDLPVEEILD